MNGRNLEADANYATERTVVTKITFHPAVPGGQDSALLSTQQSRQLYFTFESQDLPALEVLLSIQDAFPLRTLTFARLVALHDLQSEDAEVFYAVLSRCPSLVEIHLMDMPVREFLTTLEYTDIVSGPDAQGAVVQEVPFPNLAQIDFLDVDWLPIPEAGQAFDRLRLALAKRPRSNALRRLSFSRCRNLWRSCIDLLKLTLPTADIVWDGVNDIELPPHYMSLLRSFIEREFPNVIGNLQNISKENEMEEDDSSVPLEGAEDGLQEYGESEGE
ncbi:hypothetical protein NMY22_g19461 [Coprinellus aureogranulatus]|nr:hypothetical protein NMY22_g19461 [Coprinellus aureogranulatus]